MEEQGNQPGQQIIPNQASDQPSSSQVTQLPPKPPEKSIYDVPMDLPGEKTKKRFLSKKSLLILGTTAALVILALIVILILNKSGEPKQVAQSPVTQTSQSPQIEDIPAVTTTETHKSDTLGVTLTKPTTWKVTETEDKGLRVESPEFTYLSTDKSPVKGLLRIYIRLGARTQDQKIIGRGLAIQPPEKLAYTNPLPGQRKETYLAHFGLDTTDSFSIFIIAGNFPNLKKGESLGPTYGKETDAFIIGGGYTTSDTKEDLQTTSVPLDLFSTTNAYKQAIDILKSLQLR